MNPLLILAPFLVLVAVGLWWMSRPPLKVRVTGHALCPRSRRIAKLTIVRDRRTNEVLDAIRCSEMIDPDHVVCQKRCVVDLNIIRANHLISEHALTADGPNRA